MAVAVEGGGQVAAGGDVRIFSVADFQWLQLVAGA